MTTRAEVVAQARTWIGTRWVHLGRIKGVGVDCAGVVIGVARELKLSDFDVVGYAPTPHAGTLRALCDQNMTAIALQDAQPGDVLLMAWEREPQHLAFVGNHPDGGWSLIHSWAQARRVVEHGVDDAWRARIVQAYALPGVV